MSRPAVTVRRVDEGRAEDVVALWEQLRAETVVPDAGLRRTTAETIRAALLRPETVAFVAHLDGAAVGYVVVSDRTLNPFAESACVAVEQLFIAREARRCGVAKALVAAVASYADRQGVEQVACNVPTSGRDANRFFARLGFTPLTMRRVTTTGALHRKLAGDAPAARFALDQVLLSRRRAARVRAAHGRVAH